MLSHAEVFKYEQVREFLGTVSETLSQAKTRPEFLKDILSGKSTTRDETSHSK